MNGFTMMMMVPEDVKEIIYSYTKPSLNIRCLNKAFLKRTNTKIKEMYSTRFSNIDYLYSMRICVNYETLCYYFKKNMVKKEKYNTCCGFTKKGIRCSRQYCYDEKFCYQHKNTVQLYKNTKMYRSLTNGWN